MHYWLDNYPEDFRISCENTRTNAVNAVIQNNDSYSSSNSESDQTHSSDSNEQTHNTLIDELLSLPNIDNTIHRKCLTLLEVKAEPSPDIISTNQVSYCILILLKQNHYNRC